MPVAVTTASKSLHGVTEITLMAPLRRGLIPALDARSHETRASLALRTLNGLRVNTAEVDRSLVDDVIDQIRGIHSFRLGIVGKPGEAQLLLFVAFDGGWEPYMRRIWRDLGPFLDLVFCNCEGYLTSFDHSYADYIGWVRRSQAGTEFFYQAGPVTVADLHYLRAAERERLGGSPPPASPPPAGTPFPTDAAMPALCALYRLCDMYPPIGPGNGGVPDGSGLAGVAGGVLWRAADSLLKQVDRGQPPTGLAQRPPAEQAAWRWFTGANPDQRPGHAGGGQTERLLRLDAVQGGILASYPGVSQGCLLLLHLESAGAAEALCVHLKGLLASAQNQADSSRSVWHNLAFTWAGLQRCAVPDAALQQLPQEFKEGMAARSSTLGDVMVNHPLNWPLPQAGWPQADGKRRVALGAVHAIVQIWCSGAVGDTWLDAAFKPNEVLYQQTDNLMRALRPAGVQLLAVQSMQRYGAGTGQNAAATATGHFGFVDGISQPAIGDPDVAVGDLLLGFGNSLRDAPLRGALWDHSTFLVVRKLRQDVPALQALEASVHPVPGPAAPGAAAAVPASAIETAVMGRDRSGRHPFGPNPLDPIAYQGDDTGERCPLHAHIRRANPRDTQFDGKAPPGPVPRIIRRGMSYGPLYSQQPKAPDRGLVFLAYNASIAEQFEVIQGWLAGGNSSGDGAYSGQRDLLVGLRQAEDPSTVEFHHPAPGPAGAGGAAAQRFRLQVPEQPLSTLEWGLYAFVPSLPAVDSLIGHAGAAREAAQRPGGDAGQRADEQRQRALAAQAQVGAAVIERLRGVEQLHGPQAAIDAWKLALEDMGARVSGTSANIWTAVRQLNGGVLRSAYGVLVASRERVLEVLGNDRRYSATGYAGRMRQSFGEIYLGRDDGAAYRAESTAVNQAIGSIRHDVAYAAAYKATDQALTTLLGAAPQVQTLEVRDLVDTVLADLSRQWFGLPDGQFIEPGGWHWRGDAAPPTCPGHFHAPSRYMFQPWPGADAERVGQDHGQLLRKAVVRWVAAQGGKPPALPLVEPLFHQYPGNSAADHDAIARNLIGLMMGFLPTVDGNLRGLLYEWVNDASLWTWQDALWRLAPAGAPAATPGQANQALLAPLARTLQLRPVPEQVWRTALEDHVLGGVAVRAGDRVAVSLVSALQEQLALSADSTDLALLFGGDRRPNSAHPTHACPGQAMAMGVMLGFMAAMLQRAHWRPTLSPMVLNAQRD